MKHVAIFVPDEPIADEDFYSREPERARRHLASLSRERRAQLQAEWNTPAVERDGQKGI